MDFIISTDLDTALPQVIDFNFEQLKAELEDRLTYYTSLVVTKDSIKAGKDDKAKLNTLKTAIEDKRKAVKRQCLTPYEAFEVKCKELTGMLDTAIGSIDGQVKAFENAEKDDKRKSIEQFYRNNAKELLELVPLDKLWNIKWLNKGEDLTKITAEIIATLSKIRNDLNVLRAMRLECETVVLDTYLRALDMSAALAEKNRFEEQQKRLQELAVQQAAAHEETRATRAVERAPEPAPEQMGAAQLDTVPAADIRTIGVRYFDTTPAFRADMKTLCEQHNIKYGSVK